MSRLGLRSRLSSGTLTVFSIKPIVFECQTAATAMDGGFILHQALGSVFLSELEMIVNRRRDSERDSDFFKVTQPVSGGPGVLRHACQSS